MDDSQGIKRRWFRFRLSTVLILTAILAWAMAQWPVFDTVIVYSANEFGERFNSQFFWWYYRLFTRIEGVSSGSAAAPILVVTYPHLSCIYPVVALCAFLIWKAAWAVFEHRRRRSAAPE